jgi:hypothetical protein
MNKPFRFLLLASLLAPAIAQAQTTTTTTTVLGVPASLEVSRLAPQLLAFVGSQANFDSLVNGLALGTPITLSTTLPSGQVQVTSFTPQSTMTPTQIAQTLESARQSLISRGIATPNGQQVAVSLTGGVLPTLTGNVQVAGALPTTSQPAQAAAGATGPGTSVTTTTTTATNPNGAPSPAALLQGQSAAGGTTPPSPAAQMQNQREGNISNSPTAGNISNTPSTSTATTTTGTTAGTTATTGATTSAPLAPTQTAPTNSRFGAPAR